jgi:hypothetical protein
VKATNSYFKNLLTLRAKKLAQFVKTAFSELSKSTNILTKDILPQMRVC